MNTKDNENFNKTSISSRNTPSPINNFDETFVEFVRQMSSNFQSSTPEGKSKSISNNSNASTSNSSVIVSGAILSSFQSTVTASTITIKNAYKKNPAIIGPSKTLDWIDLTKEKENIPNKIRNEFPQSIPMENEPIVISDDEDTDKKICSGRRFPPDKFFSLNNKIQSQANAFSFPSTSTAENVQVQAMSTSVEMDQAFVNNEPIPIDYTAIAKAPIPLINRSLSSILVQPSPILILCKAVEVIPPLDDPISSEVDKKIEDLPVPSSSKIEEIEDSMGTSINNNAIEVGYLEEECFRRKRGRPRKAVNPVPKNRPGRPRKPFDFDRILGGLRYIKLPNSFWSVGIHMNATMKQVCFSRTVLAKTNNLVPNDRVVEFTNSIKYTVRIDNRKVKLIAAPETFNTYKDVQILLKIVNDINPNDPMVEYYS